jgi:hypothetical protein
MTFTEAKIVEADLRDLFAGAASVRLAQLLPNLAQIIGKVTGHGWHRRKLFSVDLLLSSPGYWKGI